MRISDIPRKKKWQVFLWLPLVTSVGAYFFRAIIQVGWPSLSSGLGMTTGFFIGSVLIGITNPGWIMRKKARNPTRLQRIGRIVVYSILAGVFLFYFIRFFVIILS